MMLQEHALPVTNSADIGSSALSGAEAAREASSSNLIVHPAEIEQMARLSVRQARRQSPIAIRMALAASVTYGQAWFPATDVARKLGSGIEENGSIVASRLVRLGVAETRMTACAGYRRTDARLTLPLVSIDHFFGRLSQQMMMDINTYCSRYPKATSLIALLIAGMRLYSVVTSDALAKFIEPEFDRQRSPCAASKPLRRLADAGILDIVPDRRGPTRPFLVIPIDHAI